MIEKIEVGGTVRGKVTGIQPYGAFIALSDDKQGLVHISEITNGYVKNIHDYLNVGDEISVKVLAIEEESGKISLSLKAVTEPEESSNQNNKEQINRLEMLLDSSGLGFSSLKEKLVEWIEESQKDSLMQNK